jgi:hypothetical protein
MSWDLFVMDLPQGIRSAHALPPGWAPGPLPAREDIVRAILQIDPMADASDPAWVRLNGPDFSVEINLSGKTPLTEFACHVRGGELAVGFIAALLERLQLRALDPGSETGLFDPETASDSLSRWRQYRDRVVAEQQLADERVRSSEHFTFTVVARLTEPLQPVARGARYEVPLAAELKPHGCGRVTGGVAVVLLAGSQLNERFEIAFVDIEMALADLDGALALARTTLASLGAPADSALHFMRDGKPRALPISGDGPESDSLETLAALARRLVSTPTPTGTPTYDPQ